ncbi:hypothetical protein [Streptomyces sp. NPDC047315]|uniref:hypothetical protein n=1 Tax=Streptomyces sp. NPDC047315 TaxID=3155142 RepID=UPI0033CF5B07
MSTTASSAGPDAGSLVRRDAVLIVAVRMDAPPGEPYRPGPLERRWRVGRDDEVVSSAVRRAAYTSTRLRPLLWDEEVRWHREVDGAVSLPPSPARFELSAIELVRLNEAARAALWDMGEPPDADGVAVLHGRLPPDAPARLPQALRRCANIDPHQEQGAQRTWVSAVLPPGCRIAGTERDAVHGTLITAGASGLPPRFEGPGFDGWELADQWLWALQHASGEVPLPDALERIQSRRLPLSGKVRGVAGLRGVSLVATHPDPGPGAPGNYYDGTSYQLATLHTDALVLARLQQLLLDAFGNEVARIGAHEPHQRKVAQLERDLLLFRRSYWSAGFGRQRPAAAITRIWQQHAGLPEAVQGLVDDLAELSRQVQAAETETTNAILGLLAAVGLPLTAGLAVWQGLPEAGAASLGRALAVTAVATAVLVTFFPGLRRLFVDLFRRGGRRRGRRRGSPDDRRRGSPDDRRRGSPDDRRRGSPDDRRPNGDR